MPAFVIDSSNFYLQKSKQPCERLLAQLTIYYEICEILLMINKL